MGISVDSLLLEPKQPDKLPIHIGTQFTIELGVYVYNLPPISIRGAVPWATLYAAGEASEAINYKKPLPLDGTSRTPTLRIGFCNRELKLLLEMQMLDQSAPFELWANEAITPRPGLPYQFAAVVDGESRLAELYVDAKRIAWTTFDGVPTISRNGALETGAGSTYPMLYARAWRKCLNREELQTHRFCPTKATAWDQSFDADKSPVRVSIAHDGPIAHLSVLHLHERIVDSANRTIAVSILNTAGESVGDEQADREVCRAAGVLLSALLDELESKLSNPHTREPDLLEFFKDNPAASFLLCQSHIRNWREKQLQDFGIIDFVFETSVGSYLAIEIESPHRKIFRTNTDFTADCNHAIGQVENWVSGIASSPETFRRHFGDPILGSISRMVIIGSSAEINTSARRAKWYREREKGTTLLTWDDVANIGRTLRDRLFDPVILATPWGD